MAIALDPQSKTGICILFTSEGVDLGLQDDLKLFKNCFFKAFQNFEELNITPQSKDGLTRELQEDLPYKHAVLYFTGIGNIESNKGRKGEVYILLTTMSNEKVYIKDIVQELEKKKFESCHLFFELCLPPSYCDPIPNQVVLPVSNNFVVAISGLNKDEINRKVYVYDEPRVGHWTENLSKHLTNDLPMTTILDMTWHDILNRREAIMLPHYVASRIPKLNEVPSAATRSQPTTSKPPVQRRSSLTEMVSNLVRKVPIKKKLSKKVDPKTAAKEISEFADSFATLDLKALADALQLQAGKFSMLKVQYSNDKQKFLMKMLDAKQRGTTSDFTYSDLMTAILNTDSVLHDQLMK